VAMRARRGNQCKGGVYFCGEKQVVVGPATVQD